MRNAGLRASTKVLAGALTKNHNEGRAGVAIAIAVRAGGVKHNHN
jgi:hypothetical protein